MGWLERLRWFGFILLYVGGVYILCVLLRFLISG